MKIVCAALLAALVFLFFSPVLSFDFVNWDDDVYVYDNPSIRGFEPANLRRWFTRPQVRLYVPAAMMSYAADYALHGNRAGGFHATNLALHLANSLLAFWILFSVSGNAWASFLGALLFALHPAQIEPVAWISERKSLLSAFFSLGAFVLFMRPPGRAGLERALSPALLAVVCLLAVLSKITAIVLPAVFFAYDLYSGRTVTKGRIGFYAVFFLAGVLGAVITAALYPELWENLRLNFTAELLLSPPARLARYVQILFWPVGLDLFYALEKNAAAVLGGSVVFLSLLAGISGLARAKKPAGFWLLWTLLWLAPALLLPTAPVNDRHLYLPLLGLSAFFVSALFPFRKVLYALLTALVLALLPVFQTRLPAWSDSESLWKSVLSRSPDDYRALLQLADHFQAKGRATEAIQCHERLIRLYPDEIPAYVNLGALLLSYGRFDEAESVAASLERYHRNHAEYFILRAAIANRRGDRGRALDLLKQALDADPGNKAAMLNLAKFYFQEKKWEAAVSHLERLLASDDHIAEAHYYLGLALMQTGRWEEAQKRFRLMVRRDLYHPGLYFQLGYACLKSGQRREAESWYRQSVRNEPDIAEALYHLGLLHFQDRKFGEAAAYFRRAAELEPDNPNPRNMLRRSENAR